MKGIFIGRVELTLSMTTNAPHKRIQSLSLLIKSSQPVAALFYSTLLPPEKNSRSSKMVPAWAQICLRIRAACVPASGLELHGSLCEAPCSGSCHLLSASARFHLWGRRCQPLCPWLKEDGDGEKVEQERAALFCVCAHRCVSSFLQAEREVAAD